MGKGIFISLEGIEGTGKTTQAKLLSERLSKEGYDVVLTKEPGGTVIGSRIREILLQPDHTEMSYLAELLLYNADRAQHLNEKILPAVNNGKIVITDRFTDSTIAYQGYGRGIDIEFLRSIDLIATGGIRPDLTILFDLDVETGLMRNKGANKVREGYLKILEAEPGRIKIVDASMQPEQIREKVWEIVEWRLKMS